MAEPTIHPTYVASLVQIDAAIRRLEEAKAVTQKMAIEELASRIDPGSDDLVASIEASMTYDINTDNQLLPTPLGNISVSLAWRSGTEGASLARRIASFVEEKIAQREKAKADGSS